MKNFLIFVFIYVIIGASCAQGQIHCPADGVVKIDPETNETICCKDGYLYEWSSGTNDYILYTTYSIICGCPEGGTIIGGVCCKNNLSAGSLKSDSEPIYAFANPLCGCPKGGHEKNGRCCLNGKGWNKRKQNYTSQEAECGCPDGGYAQFLDSGHLACCKKGYYLSKGGYHEWDRWGTCKCQGSILCYLRQFKDRLIRRIKGENECCA